MWILLYSFLVINSIKLILFKQSFYEIKIFLVLHFSTILVIISVNMSNNAKAIFLFSMLIVVSLMLPIFLSSVKSVNAEVLNESLICENGEVGKDEENFVEKDDEIFVMPEEDEFKEIYEEDNNLSELNLAQIELENNANVFYSKLQYFNDLYYFALFQSNYIFRAELATSEDVSLFSSVNEKLKICSSLIERKIVEYFDEELISFNILLEDDEISNLLNEIYDELLEVCEIRQKIADGFLFN